MLYRSIASIVVFFLLATNGIAQVANGTITGTVSDVTGAVLPGVEVSVINEGTNQARNLLTNESGNYTANLLSIGEYRVEAVLPGFQTAIRSGITLQTEQRARIDLVLQVGQVTEVVEVSAEAPLIQTEDSSIGTVIDAQKVTELPLNGRNFESLVLLIPEAVTAHQGSHLGQRGGVVIAGMDEHYQSFYVDGVDNVDTIIRNFAYRPSVDAIEEFKVQSTGYSAEFGRNAGAVVSVTTRSGTNEFHGAAWNFHRSNALDKKNYFAPKDQDPGFLRNMFGATLGGPIVKDRTFFFVAFEGLRQRQQVARRATVPTVKMRAGDLSELGTIKDPDTGLAFANNVIPRSRWAALTTEVLDGDFWPEPNTSGKSSNLVGAPNKRDNYDNISIKIDHSFSDVHRIAGRYSYAAEDIFNPFGGETSFGRKLPNFGQGNPRFRTSTGMNITSVFSPTLINEFRIGFNRFAQPLSSAFNSLAPRVGLTRVPLPPVMASIARNRDTFDTFNLTGQVENLGAGGGFWRLNNTWNIINNFTINTGNHSIKVGVDYRKMDFHNITGAPNTYTFDGSFSGQPFGDFLLGLPRTVATQKGIGSLPAREYGRERKEELALYLQDDWKVSPQLTINWGIRWEYYDPLTALNGLSGYNRATDKIHVICRELYKSECALDSLDPAIYTYQMDAGEYPVGLTEPDKNNLAPRFGFAYRPVSDSNTVIRGSYGVFYDSDDRHKSFCCVKNAPFNRSLSYRSTSTTPQIDLDVDPFPAALGRTGALRTGAYDRNERTTYSQRWNIGVQHELGQSLMVDISYVGSNTLKQRRSRNLNQPLTPGPGSVGSRRPFPQFSSLGYTENSGSSNFHSLQTKIEQRFSSGLTFINSFMWGKAMDDRGIRASARAGAQDNYNLANEYGLSAFDLKFKYGFSYIYQFPEGSNAFTQGWQLSGIISAQSGRPYTLVMATDNSNVGNRADRPNRTCDGSIGNPTPNKWYDKSCFTKAPKYTFGNAGRSILTADGFFNWDMSFMKNTFVMDESVNIQFRAEIYNLTNHVNFGYPANAIDRGNAGSVSSTLGDATQLQLGIRIVY